MLKPWHQIIAESETGCLIQKNQNELFIPLSQWGAIKISGKDSRLFLQGQTTCQMESINEKQGSLTAFCNIKGRIYSLGYLFQVKEYFLLILPQNNAAETLNELTKFVLRSQVKFQEADVVSSAIIYSDNFKTQHTLRQYQTTCVDENILIMALLEDQPIYLILGETRHLENFFHTLPQLKIAPALQWDCFCIMKNLPIIYHNNTGLFTPHELNLPKLNAVNFQKGCYRGQEIIARMQFLGKTHYELKSASLTIAQGAALLPGMNVLDEDHIACGKTVNILEIDQGKFLVLISFKNFHAEKKYFLQQVPIEIIA